MSVKSEEETFERDVDELNEEEFAEDVEEEEDDNEQKSDTSEKNSNKRFVLRLVLL